MKTRFFILGCLDEYMGRFITENGHEVETFYRSEEDVAYIFKKYLLKLAREQQLDPTIETRAEGDTGWIIFLSRALTAFIDACYTYDFSTSMYLTVSPEPRRVHAYISKEVFEPGDREATLSFLAGAYLRYGEGSVFRFANAKHKAELIQDLLKEVGCSGVGLARTNPGYVPAVYEVSFTPSDEIGPWLTQSDWID